MLVFEGVLSYFRLPRHATADMLYAFAITPRRHAAITMLLHTHTLAITSLLVCLRAITLTPCRHYASY